MLRSMLAASVLALCLVDYVKHSGVGWTDRLGASGHPKLPKSLVF